MAVVDVSQLGRSQVKGFVPVGWYPTAVRFSQDGKSLFVLSGKGLASMPNPRGPQPGVLAGEQQYSGSMLQGAFSVVPVPDVKALAAYTDTVRRLTPYTDATRLAPAGAPDALADPPEGGRSLADQARLLRHPREPHLRPDPRRHGEGQRRPDLCLFGEDVTPNAHALAREFVLLDNFYVDAEVSYDGHAFSTGAYATDFVEKIWPMNYGQRGGRYLSEGGGAMRNPYGNVTAPSDGYIWDACIRAGKSVRSYGEFAGRGEEDDEHDVGEGVVRATVPGLEGRVHPSYPPFDLAIPDDERVDVWLEEFREFEKNGQLPHLSIIRPRQRPHRRDAAGVSDAARHDRGERPGPRPARRGHHQEPLLEGIRDLRARGRRAERPGPRGRAPLRGLRVASPYARRGTVDSTLYTTSGMLRTMELILGLPPMSQYDAAATPFYNAFQDQPVLTAFTGRTRGCPSTR